MIIQVRSSTQCGYYLLRPVQKKKVSGRNKRKVFSVSINPLKHPFLNPKEAVWYMLWVDPLVLGFNNLHLKLQTNKNKTWETYGEEVLPAPKRSIPYLSVRKIKRLLMTNILIVENELITAYGIKTILEKQGYQVFIEMTGEAALRVITSQQVDLILMDIHIDGDMNGIAASKIIKTRYNIPIIFITQDDSNEVFQDAIQTVPIQYINKPFTDRDLCQAIIVALAYTHHQGLNNQAQEREEVFIYNNANEYQKVHLYDILYVQASGAYTNIHVLQSDSEKSRIIKLTKSSNHVVEELKHRDIIQVHRSYFVNLGRIDRYHAHEVYVGKIVIPVSKTYRENLEARLPFLKKK
jgi:DNA-binding LytR/AlgR family response regulator